VKGTKNFQQTLDKETLEFLESWYNMPIQDILRTLAAVDRASKEAKQ
jgi:hypothetical protein